MDGSYYFQSVVVCVFLLDKYRAIPTKSCAVGELAKALD